MIKLDFQGTIAGLILKKGKGRKRKTIKIAELSIYDITIGLKSGINKTRLEGMYLVFLM